MRAGQAHACRQQGARSGACSQARKEDSEQAGVLTRPAYELRLLPRAKDRPQSDQVSAEDRSRRGAAMRLARARSIRDLTQSSSPLSWVRASRRIDTMRMEPPSPPQSGPPRRLAVKWASRSCRFLPALRQELPLVLDGPVERLRDVREVQTPARFTSQAHPLALIVGRVDLDLVEPKRRSAAGVVWSLGSLRSSPGGCRPTKQ